MCTQCDSKPVYIRELMCLIQGCAGTCRCEKGYDGRNCEKGPDLCKVANPCQNGGTCHVEDGQAKCSCTQREYIHLCIDIVFVLIVSAYM